MPLQDLSDLSPESRQVVEAYLHAVETSLCSVSDATRKEALEDVSAHLLEVLSAESTPHEARAATAELGEPDVFAGELCAVLDAIDTRVDAEQPSRVLGVPYEFRVPSAERVASRWWDPANPQILVPRVFGIGWDLNFGALAVRLGLIEPDAEDEPFASTTEPAFIAALVVPLALLAFIIGSYLLQAAELPVRLPVHWGTSGRADNWAPTMWAFLPLAFFSAASTVWAVWSTVIHRPPFLRGAVIGFATFLSGISAAIWALTLLSVAGVESAWLPPLVVVMSAVVLPLMVLTGLARSGRRVEIARDLGEKR